MLLNIATTDGGCALSRAPLGCDSQDLPGNRNGSLANGCHMQLILAGGR